MIAGLWLALIGAPPVLAQYDAPCTASLAAAQDYYVDQDFAISETLLRECITRNDVDAVTAVQVHRLLALVYLRQSKRPEAEQVVARLLDISFGYTPDPVLDPPAYVALVESIKEPLRAERERTPPVAETPTQATEPRPRALRRTGRALYAHATLGAGNYGGERGTSGASWLSSFTKNSGVSFSLGADLSLNRTLGVNLSYRLHHIPPLLTLRSADRTGDVGDHIDPDASSKWVHLFAFQGRAYYPLEGRTSPYLELGVSGSVSRINDTVRAGLGPRGGIGLDVQIAPRFAAFMGFSATVLFPGTAVDHIDSRAGQAERSGSDLLSFAEVGLRYRIRTW